MTRLTAKVHGLKVSTGPLGTEWTITKDTFEEMRQGYRCAKCLEPQATPFPETCFLCGFRISDDQLSWLAREIRFGRLDWPERELEWDDGGDVADQQFVEWFWRRKAERLGVVLPKGTVFE